MARHTVALQVFREINGLAYRYRLRGRNGEIMLASEAYPTRGNALRAARQAKAAMAQAEIEDLTK